MEMFLHILFNNLLLTIAIDASYATVNTRKGVIRGRKVTSHRYGGCSGVTCLAPDCPPFDQYTPDGKCCPACRNPELCSLSRWNHEDQTAWEPDVCQTGQRQSPIDLSCRGHLKLKTDLVELMSNSVEKSNGERIGKSNGQLSGKSSTEDLKKRLSRHFPSGTCTKENRFVLSLRGFEDPLEEPEIINLGSTVEVEIPEGQYFYAERLDTNTGAIDMYRLAQFHFHWGERETGGTEHTINGKRYDLESHFVFFNVKFASAAEAVADGSAGGLLVLGTLYEITEEYNPALELIAELVRNVQDQVGSHYDFLGAIDLRPLLPFDHLESFFHYMGSLTTPPCTEIVNWFVFMDIIQITEAQWEAFRGVLNCAGEEYENFRDIQDRNDREIWSQDKVKHKPYG